MYVLIGNHGRRGYMGILYFNLLGWNKSKWKFLSAKVQETHFFNTVVAVSVL